MTSNDNSNRELGSYEDLDWNCRLLGVHETVSGAASFKEWQEYERRIREHKQVSYRLLTQILNDIAMSSPAKEVRHE